MYPLNMSLPAPECGFACASDEAEHKALSDAGYLPAFAGSVAVAEDGLSRAEMISALEAKGVRVDKRWADARLADELAKQ